MLDSALRRRLLENLEQIRAQIATAAQASGRTADAVRLVGVTKYVSAGVARALVEAGLHDLGESRPQALWEKSAALSDLPQTRWHFIGHLQRNKVRRTLPSVSLLHAGDSLRLLEAWNEAAAELATTAVEPLPPRQVLLEVNISGDAAKHGFAPEEIEPLLAPIAELRQLQVVGLMAMASIEGGPARAQSDFAKLRILRDLLQTVAPVGMELRELSMGMSGDFIEAIAEGATLVRVGSALFEGVESA